MMRFAFVIATLLATCSMIHAQCANDRCATSASSAWNFNHSPVGALEKIVTAPARATVAVARIATRSTQVVARPNAKKGRALNRPLLVARKR